MQASEPAYFNIDTSRVAEIRGVIRVVASNLTIPLFLLFWIADLMYVPELKWQLLFIRFFSIPLCLGVQKYSLSLKSEYALKKLMIVYAILTASIINIIIFIIPDPLTPYYAGLGMVATGSLSFMPLSKREFAIAAIGIYLPYYLIVTYRIDNLQNLYGIVINSFFICGSILMCFVIRFFQEELRVKEIDAKNNLKTELDSRELTIRKKTDEGVKLTALSKQFSPQVVDSIREGRIDIDSSGQRSEICAIFVDIVNSTERVNSIDKDDVEKVLTRFLDDTIKILLKYDITVDKFLGDGILGFCNAPVKRHDYTTRVVFAALEIRDKIRSEREFYFNHWGKEFETRIGIAKGFANIGFYGSQKYYRSYTAIGSVMNLASRLCSVAEAGQILVDKDVNDTVQDTFKIEFVAEKNLKGFVTDSVQTFKVLQANESISQVKDNLECIACGTLLTLDTDSKGHFIFSCKSCDSPGNIDDANSSSAA